MPRYGSINPVGLLTQAPLEGVLCCLSGVDAHCYVDNIADTTASLTLGLTKQHSAIDVEVCASNKC